MLTMWQWYGNCGNWSMSAVAIAAQFLNGKVIALFELTLQTSEINVVEERHYRMALADQLDVEAIRIYRP